MVVIIILLVGVVGYIKKNSFLIGVIIGPRKLGITRDLRVFYLLITR